MVSTDAFTIYFYPCFVVNITSSRVRRFSESSKIMYWSIHGVKSLLEIITKAVEQIFLNGKSLFTFSAGALH